MDLINSNVVAAGRGLMPQNLTPGWLFAEKLFTETDLDKPYYPTIVTAQVPSSIAYIGVTEANLTVVPFAEESKRQEFIIDKVPTLTKKVIGDKGIINMMGINFIWVENYKNNPCEDTRKMFFLGTSKIFEIFDSPSSAFGTYLSKEWSDGFRLKLTILPAMFMENGHQIHKLQFSFNFHKDLNERDAFIDFEKSLNFFDKFRTQSQALVDETFSVIK